MKTPTSISMHARTLFVVIGSLKNKIPIIMLVIGSNRPTMLVTVGPVYLMLIGTKVLAKNDTKNATKRTKAASIKLDPSKMTDEQIAELEERAARGERITF
jgi:uncharacterized protein YfaA (DUF2138 family)